MISFERMPTRILALIIVVVGLSIYASSLSNEFVNLDDPLLIYENKAVQELSFESLKTIFTTYDPELYVPLTLFSYQLEHFFVGLNPFFYHLTNLLLHVANALLVFWLAYFLSKDRLIGFVTGFLFLVHPAHAEAVVWAAARKDVLATFFFLLSCITFLRFQKTRKKTQYASSIFFFLAALLSKVVVLMLPVILLLVDWWKNGKVTASHIKEKIPFFVLSTIFGIVAIGGKSALIDNTNLWEKFLMATKSTMFYLQKLFVPTRLSTIYPYDDKITIASSDFFLPLAAFLILLAFVWMTYRFTHAPDQPIHEMSRSVRGFASSFTREVVFGLFFFFLMLLPTFVNISKGGNLFFASDRYAYIPSIGIFFLAALLLKRFYDSQLRPLVSIVFLSIVAIFSFLSFERSHVWADSEQFNQDIISKYPRSFRAHYNLGYWYQNQQREEEAAKKYLDALDVFPRHADSLVNLSILYSKQQGYGDDVLRKFEEVVQLIPMEAKAHHNLGVAYQKVGRTDEAIEKYLQAIGLDVLYSEARHALAEAYGEKGMFREAIEQYEIIVETDPDYAESANIRIPNGG